MNVQCAVCGWNGSKRGLKIHEKIDYAHQERLPMYELEQNHADAVALLERYRISVQQDQIGSLSKDVDKFLEGK